MSEIKLNIDGREVRGFEGQTILDVARENGVNIPTLCHDERVQMYGACGICVVEAEGTPRLLRSCSTHAADGMVIMTDTKRVRSSRKTALELLLSDHAGDCRPPCVLACPAGTDCQGYVGLIANGEYEESLKLVRDKIPLPGSIGRVCPHPCESACRRELVEEPVSIAALKQFVADRNMASGKPAAPEPGADTGKSVAVIGGGPGGLTAAYSLRVKGHAVTVYDAMPHMGGMLRYGIPEYRLPKAYLQTEIDVIESMGATFKNNIKVGRDITFEYIRSQFDAVIVAVGAWKSSGLRCKGEELEGVLGGIEFLRDAAMNNPVLTGRRVAVVGGGNTAMDACRTSVRLGAEKVYNIYRRTRNEMPAEDIEIDEAGEEGVIFKNLTNPIEVVGENGRVKAIRLQVMELGEPDSSGRRAPVPVEGKEEILEVDAVIAAIGQKLDPIGIEAVELTKWGTISADEKTFRTSLEGVFAIGDAVNNGADIAIAAIGEAQRAAVMADRYLNGEELAWEEPFLVKTEPEAEDFADRERNPRAKMPHRGPEERKRDFLEINLGLSEEEAKREAERCLECGCHDYFECKLIELAGQYDVKPAKYKAAARETSVPEEHPYIRRNPDKCILCGLCVRICDETVGSTALGLVGRGFDTVVKPALDLRLRDTDCVSCGQCVSVCPTGALTETMMIDKQVPTEEKFTRTTCGFCGVGCRQELTSVGGLLKRALPSNERKEDALLCMKGRFGFGELGKITRLTSPLIKRGDGFEEVSCEQAAVYANKRLQAIRSRHGADSVAVSISDRYTNEEAFLIKKYANEALGTENVFSIGKTRNGVARVLGRDGSTVGFDELKNTDCVLLVESDIRKPHLIAGLAVRQAVKNGAKLIVMNSFDSAADELAALRVEPGADLSLLKQIVRLAMEKQGTSGIEGYGELSGAVRDTEPGADAKAVADMYLGAKKAVIIFEQDVISADAAGLLSCLAVLSGHIGKPRSGIIQLKPGANSQGLADLGVSGRRGLGRLIREGKVKGLFIFGEDAPDFDVSGLEFLAVQDLQMTETAKKADIVFPASSFAESDGTFTNTVGKRQNVRAAVAGPVAVSNFSLLMKLAEQAGRPFSYREVSDVTGVLPSSEGAANLIKLAAPKGDRFLRRHRFQNTNALYASLMDFAARHGL